MMGIPYMPYKDNTKKGFFKKYEYVLSDEEYDRYLSAQMIRSLCMLTIIRNGYRQYKSDPKDCKDYCPLLETKCKE